MSDDMTFAEKCRYWRENGTFGVTYAGGQDSFHNKPSVFEQERKIVADAKARGADITRYDPTVRRPKPAKGAARKAAEKALATHRMGA